MNPIERIEKAVAAIEEQLLSELSTTSIAAQAGLSPWHFQRTFRAFVGESVGSYVRKRRLSRSVANLLDGDDRILDIALRYGFDSQEAYTRAFKSMFGIPPGRFRDRGQRVTAQHMHRATRERLAKRWGEVAMEPRFVDRESTRYVGLQARFIAASSERANNMEVIPALWGRFFGRRDEIEKPMGDDTFGLCLPLPEKEKVDPDEFLYMACVAVEPACPVPDGMAQQTLPASRYAVFEHSEPLPKLGETINYVFATWLPASPYTFGEGVDFERYDDEFDPDVPGSGLEFWLPIRAED